MKKDRNCNMPYQMYPTYMPNYNPQPIAPFPVLDNDIEKEINIINNKLANLERRINNLESINTNNYNNSGYQMM